MKSLFLILFFISSFAFGQSKPIMLNKVDTMNKKVNISGMYLEKCADYQEKSFYAALLGAVFTPLILYTGINSNNKDIVYLSYAVGLTFSFGSLHYKFKSIESIREAGRNLPYQYYTELK